MIRDPVITVNSWVNAPKEWNGQWDIEEEWFLAEKKHQENPSGFYGLKKWIEAAKIMEACQSSPNFLLIRYEDLVSKQESEVGRLFEFSNLQISKQTLRFLESSKNSASRDPYSVFRGGLTIPMKISGEIRQKISEEVEANGLGRYLS